MLPPISNAAKQWILFVLTVALAVLPELAKLEPAWTWTSRALAVVTVLLGIFRTDSSGTAAEKKALKEQVIRLTGSLASVPSERGGASGAGLGAILIVCGAAMGMTRCSWLQSPQGAATEQAAVDLLVCVLNHSSESVNQIVTDCGASTAADVIKILDAAKSMQERAKDAGR